MVYPTDLWNISTGCGNKNVFHCLWEGERKGPKTARWSRCVNAPPPLSILTTSIIIKSPPHLSRTVSSPACHRSPAAGGRQFGPQSLLVRRGPELFLHGKRIRLWGVSLTSVIFPQHLPGCHATISFARLWASGLQFLPTQKLIRNAGSRPSQTCWGSICLHFNKIPGVLKV